MTMTSAWWELREEFPATSSGEVGRNRPVEFLARASLGPVVAIAPRTTDFQTGRARILLLSVARALLCV